MTREPEGAPGQAMTVTVRSNFGNWLNGATRLALGPGIAVGGGDLGSVLESIGAALCRRPVLPPLLSMRGDQQVTLGCSDGTTTCASPSVTTTVGGEFSRYTVLPGNSLTYQWNVVSGPGSVVFTNAAASATPASFSAAGTYVLELVGRDGVSEARGRMTVIVNPLPTGGATQISSRLEPAVAGPLAAGTLLEYRMRFLRNFEPQAGATVTVTVTGANAQTAQVFTDANGVAVIQLRGVNVGRDTVVYRTKSGQRCPPTLSRPFRAPDAAPRAAPANPTSTSSSSRSARAATPRRSTRTWWTATASLAATPASSVSSGSCAVNLRHRPLAPLSSRHQARKRRLITVPVRW